LAIAISMILHKYLSPISPHQKAIAPHHPKIAYSLITLALSNQTAIAPHHP